MGRIDTHRISICTGYRPDDRAFQAGYRLVKKLRDGIDAAGDLVSDAFEISGLASLEDCGCPYQVAYFGSRNAVYLFGDVAPDVDIDALVAFARQHGPRRAEWNTSFGQYDIPRETLLALGAASVIALERSTERLQ